MNSYLEILRADYILESALQHQVLISNNSPERKIYFFNNTLALNTGTELMQYCQHDFDTHFAIFYLTIRVPEVLNKQFENKKQDLSQGQDSLPDSALPIT